MTEPEFVFPVKCPICSQESLVGFRISVVANALETGEIRLYANCHVASWQASASAGGLAQNQICDSMVLGDLQFQNNGTAVEIGSALPACAGNIVRGNLEVNNNTGSTAISDDIVVGNLQDHNNTAATRVFNNFVEHNLECQNNPAISGGGNLAKQKQGQCSAF